MNITVDITAINMGGSGSYSDTFHVNSKEALRKVKETFDATCPFAKCEVECYAEQEDGTPLTDEQRGWFDELGISL